MAYGALLFCHLSSWRRASAILMAGGVCLAGAASCLPLLALAARAGRDGISPKQRRARYLAAPRHTVLLSTSSHASQRLYRAPARSRCRCLSGRHLSHCTGVYTAHAPVARLAPHRSAIILAPLRAHLKAAIMRALASICTRPHRRGIARRSHSAHFRHIMLCFS